MRPDEPLIKFIGVWDTVDAVGLPVDELSTMVDRLFYPHRFQNQDLSRQVERACHAIAVDDERYTFHPVLWNEGGTGIPSASSRCGLRACIPTSAAAIPTTVSPRLALLDDGEGPLRPGRRAEGLRFDRSIVCGSSSSAPSRSARCTTPDAASACTTATSQDVWSLCHDPANGVEIAEPKIHHSVFKRIANNTGGIRHRRPAYLVSAGRCGRADLAPTRDLETASGRKVRAELLLRAQDHVFWRRVLYYASCW